MVAFPDLDPFSLRLIAEQEGVSPECCVRMNAALVLLLANQMTDTAILADCIRAARAIAAPELFGHLR